MSRTRSANVTNFEWKRPLLFWSVAVLACLVVASIAALIFPPNNQPVDSFQTCKEAGGRIAESYPEQCFINGTSFVNVAQINKSEYVGLAEQEALAKAKSTNTPARIVERNGESLPVTMDFVFGRLNFYISDDTVYKVDVEGER